MASIAITHRPAKRCYQVHGYQTVDGQRIALPGKTFSTLKAAELYRAELLLNADRDGVLDPGRMTFGAYLEYWIAHHPKPLSITTRGGYLEHIRRAKGPLGHIPLAKLRAGDLDRTYGMLSREGGRPRSIADVKNKTVRPLSTTTVNNFHRCMKTALRQGFKWGFIPSNVADRATPPPMRRSASVRSYSGSERAAILDAASSSSYPFLSALLTLLAMTGLRRSEAIGLAVTDIDLNACTLTVRRTVVQAGREVAVRENVGKSSSSLRTIHLPAPLLPVLHRQIAAVSAEVLKFGPGYCRDPLLLFPGVGGFPLRPNSLSTTFRRVNRVAGVNAPPVHTLRHTAATVMLGAGIDIATIAAQLGHASPAITARVYLHADDERSKAGAATLGSIFDTVKKV